MNLSKTVQAPDPQIPVAAPSANSSASNDACPSVSTNDFSDLLADNADAAKDRGKAKERPEADAKTAAEAAASVLSGWLLSAQAQPKGETKLAEWNSAAAGEATAAEGTSTDCAVTTDPELLIRGGRIAGGFRPRDSEVGNTAAGKAGTAFGVALKSKELPTQVAPTSPTLSTAPASDGTIAGTETLADGSATQPSANPLSSFAEVAAETVAADANSVAGPGAGTPVLKGGTVRGGLKPLSQMRASEGQANIAPGGMKSLPGAELAGMAKDKKILSADEKAVTETSRLVGIDGAMGTSPMNSWTQHDSTTVAANAVHSVVAASQGSSTGGESSSNLSAVSDAHRAVEAVLKAADHVSASTKSSVQLNFSVGDAALSVRVQMRDGAVHAAFRTESSELRSMLATEWKSSTADRPGLAAATFENASNQSNSFSSSSGHADQQRQQAQRQSSEAFVRTSSFSSASTVEARPTAAAAASPARSDLNLYTFA